GRAEDRRLDPRARPRVLAAQQHPHEARPLDHGARARGSRPLPRRPARRARPGLALEGAAPRDEGPAETRVREEAPARDRTAEEAELLLPDRGEPGARLRGARPRRARARGGEEAGDPRAQVGRAAPRARSAERARPLEAALRGGRARGVDAERRRQRAARSQPVIQLRAIEESDVPAIVRLHVEALPADFITSLGERFLAEAFYGSILSRPEGVGVVAVQEGALMGFVVGAQPAASWY